MVGSQRRIGARSLSQVTPELRDRLERQLEPSSTHVEQMALDFSTLMRHALPDLRGVCDQMREGPFLQRMRRGGRLVWECGGWTSLEAAAASPSDTVRGWAAFAVGYVPGLDVGARIDVARRFAEDEHFAVREWAWLGIRDHVVKNTSSFLSRLAPLTLDPDPYVRRFAVEVTRPRSVWGAHVPLLVRQPEEGLHILEPLANDASRYVQDAVANWLNDAARVRPEWVREVCAAWLVSHGPSSSRVCRRALRSLENVTADQPSS